jgi:D-alanyl-D-alanine carboxypeptidase
MVKSSCLLRKNKNKKISKIFDNMIKINATCKAGNRKPNINFLKISSVLLATLLLFNSSNSLCAQTFDSAKLNRFFNRLAEKNKAMGSLAILKDNSVLYTRSIGYSRVDETEKQPSTVATRYRVGSVTKMFTAAMIFQLVDEGKLQLTDKLAKYFPTVMNADKISIENILAHKSGIHDISEDRDFRTARLSGLTKDQLLALIEKSMPDFEPGTKYAYSNTGYQLLGMLVEKLTGNAYEKELNKRITAKVGLSNTYAGSPNIDTGKNESFSYRYVSNWQQQPTTHVSLLFGSGSLVSTPIDLAKFIKALFSEALISKKSLNQMMQNKLGVDTFTYNGKTGYGHTGGIDGFGSWLVYIPEEKLAVSYATNAKVYPVTDIIDGIFNIYHNAPFTIPTFESIVVSTDLLDKYVGVYTLAGAPVKFTVTREGNTLFVQMAGQAAIRLETIAPNQFKLESPEIFFEFDAEKKQMTQKRSGRERVFIKEN